MSVITLLTLTIFLSASPFVWSAATKEDVIKQYQHLAKACMVENKITAEIIEKVNTDKIMPEDPDFKCYIKCISQKLGVDDRDGFVDADKVIDIIPDDIKTVENKKHIKSCAADKGGTSDCDKIWRFHKCIIGKTPESYFLF